jgi:hypothetical protein
MHEHQTQHEEVEIRTGIKAGEEAAPGSGMMGGGGATAPGGMMMGGGQVTASGGVTFGSGG